MPDFFDFLGGGTVAVFLVIVVLVLIVAYLGSRYKVAGANEALIRSGRATPLGGGAESGLKVVRGQGVVVLPLFHKIGKLKLTARQINVNLADAVSRQGIKVAVQGVATFKIGADDESIRNAAERFLDAQEEQVDSIVKNVLEGSLRSIVGTLTIEELNLDRQKFQQAVQDAAKGDLATSGLQIDSFTIQAIRDESGYMDLIGQQETARRERDARMAKATADQEAAVREAEAEQIKINAQRDVSLRRAETETQIAAAEARAAQAGPLAQAEATQEVVRKQTELAELEAGRKAKELLTTTVRPAEADAEAQVRRAEGDKAARIAQAQADAERVKLAGQAEAAVISVKAEADAHRTEVEGNAEALIIFNKGESEAKALALRAEAYKQFNEAAVIQTVLSMLPEIVRAAAEPMSSIDSLTVISTDGASEIVRNGTRTVAEAGAAVKSLTGIDVPALIGGATAGLGAFAGRAAAGQAESAKKAPRPGSAPSSVGAMPTATAPAAPGRPSASAPAPAPQAGMTAAQLDTAIGEATRTVERASAAAAAPLAGGQPSTSTSGAKPAAEASAAPPPPTAKAREIPAVVRALADQLRGVPAVERFAGLRLSDLERLGPRPLRDLWRQVARDVPERYAGMTIGELLEAVRS